MIQGEAGVGKSALAAHLVSSNDWFYHFTWFTGARSPENVRKNLAAQLISVFRLDNHAPGGNLPPKAGEPKYLADILQEAAAKRDEVAAGRPIVLVIDTLAEIDSKGQSDTPLGIPSAEELPRKVFVIATRRPGPPLRSVGEPILRLPIKMDEDHNRDADKHLSSTNARDMHEYLRILLDGPNPDLELLQKLRRRDMAPGVFADALVSRCAGVWIYLKYVLDDVRDGSREPADVLSLPQGLRTYYLKQIQRQQEREDGKWKPLRLPALATLAALRRPVTQDKLASLIGIRDATDGAELNSWLDKDIRAFLHKDTKGGEARYEIRHQSLRDLVAAPDPPRQSSDEDQDEDDDLSRELPNALRTAHAAITADLIPDDGDWSKADQYVRDMLAEHAANAERLDELVADPGFLLICQPSSVLLHRRDLKNADAVSAYEAALNEWAGLPSDPSERAWRLHIWARKTGASDLAVACCAIAERTPVIQAAMWTGITHRAMRAHDGSVGTIAVLPMREERPLLASGGSDGLVRLWDPDAGAPEGDPLVGYEDWVTAAAAVPTQEGQLLATGAKDGNVWFWSPQDTEPFAAPQPGHRGPVTAIAAVRLADDRTVLATGGRDGTIRIWDPAKRTLEGDPLVARAGWVTAAAPAPTPEGQLLATGADDGKVQLWDLHTRQPVGDPMTGHRGPVDAIAAVRLADDRTVIATGGRDGVKIRFWDPQTRKPVGDPITRHSSPVNAITVARLANRTLFATAGQGRTIRLWDADTGTAAALSLPVHARWVNAIAAVPLPEAGILLATGGSDGRIELQELYESATGTPATAPSSGHSGHNGQVNAIAVTKLAGQTVFVSGSRDRTVRLWNPLTGEAVKDPLTGPMGPLRAIAVVPLPDKRNLIATSDTDGTVQLWDPTTTPPTSWSLEHYAQVYAIAAVQLPDRTLLAAGGDDGTVRLWDPVTGESVGKPLAGHGGQRVNTIASARLVSGYAVLVTGGSDGTVQFWDPATRVALGDPLSWRVGRIRAVAPVPMPDGRTMFAAGGDHGVVQVWDGAERGALKRGALIGPPAAQRTSVNAITAVELPGRTLLATGSNDGMVRLWDPETGESAVGSWAGHSGPVKAIASVRLPGGPTLLASGGDDKTILIWTFG